ELYGVHSALHSFPTRRSSDLLPERFVFQVKQMDEFIQRFNAEENHEGMKINPESISMDDRAMILASLFNLDLMKDPSFRESATRSEEHTSELQSRENLVCRLL